MAVTTAQLKITSAADSLTSSAIAIDETTTLYDAGTTDGMTKTTGLARKSFAASTVTLLLGNAAYTDNKASKLYIKNTDAAGASASTVAVSLGTIGAESKIGLLHNNEWAWIPWSGASDINVECSSATTLVEWMLIFE
jgi:hypothetical protein